MVVGSNPAVPIKCKFLVIIQKGENLNKKLLEILACPICKGKLIYNKTGQQLICKYDQLAYPIRNGIPIMLADQAVTLKPDDSNMGF